MTTSISISEKIFELRKERGLTQEKLGELCGVTSQAVSKWEKAESLPDILLIPDLCAALGITADSLLGVSSDIRAKSCLEEVCSYARETGELPAAYQAVCATSYLSDRENGGAKMSSDGIKIHNTRGLALVIAGKEMLQSLKATAPASVKAMTDLVTNEGVMAVVRTLDYGGFLSEADIAQASGLSQTEVETALFKLLKQGICECDDQGRYAFGAKSYTLFALLAGMFLCSPEGFRDIGNLTCSFKTQ